MDFDALIIGGGAAGMSCALILGSGLQRTFAEGKKIGIILHQKSSHLDSALLNNAFGIPPGTTGKEILEKGSLHLKDQYPEVIQIQGEKVLEIQFGSEGYSVVTNKNTYRTSIAVIAVGYSQFFHIKGVESYVVPHSKAKASKQRLMLKNTDHLVAPGLYVAGTLAGWRSQFAIASGSGAAVGTDILSLWNGEHTKVHDKFKE